MDAAPLASAPVDAGPDPVVVAREAALKRATLWLAGLKFLVAVKKSNAKEVEGEGDAESICDAVKSARAKATDTEVAAKLDESLALCAFDIPLVYANEALDHLATASSQASVRLMCERSGQEIAKAKAVSKTDQRVRIAEARRAGRCH